MEGGFLDVDVMITDPEGKIVHQGNRETFGTYTFSATTPGRYTYCFSNKMSTMTPKVKLIKTFHNLSFKSTGGFVYHKWNTNEVNMKNNLLLTLLKN